MVFEIILILFSYYLNIVFYFVKKKIVGDGQNN